MITVYVIEGVNGKRYVGMSNNLERRLREHRSGVTKGGQLLKEFHLIHTESFSDYTSARIREKFLKAGKGRSYLNTLYPKTRSAIGG